VTARFDRARLLDRSLPDAIRARRSLALDLVEAALAAVDPEPATRRALEAIGLDRPVTAFAFGKASVAMARAAAAAAPIRAGALIALEPDARVPGFAVVRGRHPDPAADAAKTGAAILAAAEALGADDVALFLVSGGGSSMLELPREGVTVDSLSALIRRLRGAGADIAELNAVRRACSRLKGGGLARACAPARVVNVVISDVPGHPVEVVASGPSCAPPLDAPDPEAVLARYRLDFGLPATAEEGPLPRIETVVAADHRTARRALIAEAAARGLAVRDREGTFEGEASALGRRLAGVDHAWVWGGETTVTVHGGGRGGRNQELALGALVGGWSSGLLVAVGTDGVDGASDAAGALLDEAVVDAARGLDPAGALADNDSGTFFERVGAALRSGPTGTNVADLLLYLP